MQNGTAIALHDVTKRFGEFAALDHLSLSVNRGEVFGILGPNGSGKTTTVDLVSGLSRPTSGSVTVLGFDMLRDPRAVRARLGAVPQETALYDELSAWDNLVFHADLFDVPRSIRQSRIAELLDLVQLSDRQRSRVSTFSGGMRRRLALARALLHDPELLYLDEPTLGVDVQSRRALWTHILDLRRRGKTVLITTNYLEEANALCDRLAILDHGKLVALDTPEALKRAFGDTVISMQTERLISDGLLRQIRSVAGVSDAAQTDSVLKVTTQGGGSVVGEIVTLVSRETGLRSITQREPNLDEVFLSLTGSAPRD
jgi:ABC-2 type transport system ATP-binding protein